MNLSIYAIKVGKTTIEKLKVNKELDMDRSILPKDNPSYYAGKEVLFFCLRRWYNADDSGISG